jgi:hypothetical protein
MNLTENGINNVICGLDGGREILDEGNLKIFELLRKTL